jgi:hypothetical protein
MVLQAVLAQLIKVALAVIQNLLDQQQFYKAQVAVAVQTQSVQMRLAELVAQVVLV